MTGGAQLAGRHEEQLETGQRVRERRLARRAHVLAELLDRRPDLRGVHSAADLAAEAVRWSV